MGNRVTRIIGAILGLVALVIPSLRISGSLFGQTIAERSVSLIQLLDYVQQMNGDPQVVMIIIGLVGLGSLIAFIHPIGGLFQLGGGMYFAYSLSSTSTQASFLIGEISYELQYGFYLIIIAAILALLGFAGGNKQKTIEKEPTRATRINRDNREQQ